MGDWAKAERQKDLIMKELKVGIVGFGIVGKRRKDCVDRHPNLRLVAVCDKTFDGEGLLADGIRYYQDYLGLLKEDLGGLIRGIYFICSQCMNQSVK